MAEVPHILPVPAGVTVLFAVADQVQQGQHLSEGIRWQPPAAMAAGNVTGASVDAVWLCQEDGVEIGSTVIGSDGTFKAEIKPQENGTQLDIISKLKDGQISSKITVNVTSEKVVDKTSGSMEDIIQELESVVEQVEELKSQKDNNGRHIYEVNESKLKALKDNINSLKTGKDINLENIDLEIEVKEIDYGAES